MWTEIQVEMMDEELEAAVPGRMPPVLHRYWTVGEGAAKIRWGEPGDFDRCVRQMHEHVPDLADPEGMCAKLHIDALGYNTSTHKKMEHVTAAVNSSAWKSMPVAERDTPFSADDAIARILDWSGGSASKFNSAFLWRNSQGEVGNKDSYRLPIADVVNGKLHMFPRAVFAAAAILSGAHGGLVGVVDDAEKKQLKGVVSEIYDELQKMYQDPRTVPPWERGGNDREDVTAAMEVEEEAVGAQVWEPVGLTAAV